MTTYVWAKTGIGMERHMTKEQADKEGLEYEEVSGGDAVIDGAPALATNNKILTAEERAGVYTQLGVECDTWGDLKKALGDEHRIVEPGDKVDRELSAIREQKAIDLENARG